jgi:hypothetical protein
MADQSLLNKLKDLYTKYGHTLGDPYGLLKYTPLGYAAGKASDALSEPSIPPPTSTPEVAPPAVESAGLDPTMNHMYNMSHGLSEGPEPADDTIIGPEEAVDLSSFLKQANKPVPVNVSGSPAPGPSHSIDFGQGGVANADNARLAAQLSNQNALNANLLKAADTFSSGVGRTKPVSQEAGDALLKQAGAPEEQYKAAVQNEKDNPNSPISKGYREAMKRFGVEVKGNASAASLEKIAPWLKSAYEQDEARKQRAFDAEQNRLMRMSLAQNAAKVREGKESERIQEKDVKRFDDLNKRLSAEMSSSRSAFGKSANIIRSAEALERLAAGINPNDIDNRQIQEFARGLDAMLSSGAATISGTAHLVPRSASGDAAKIAEYIMSKPKGAQQGEFVKRMLETVAREKELAKEQIRKTQGKALASYSDLKDKYPDKWGLILSQNDLPEDILSPASSKKEEAPHSGKYAPGSMVKVKGKLYQVAPNGDDLIPQE